MPPVGRTFLSALQNLPGGKRLSELGATMVALESESIQHSGRVIRADKNVYPTVWVTDPGAD